MLAQEGTKHKYALANLRSDLAVTFWGFETRLVAD